MVRRIRYLIDPPTPFAPLAEWEAFREDLLKLDQDDYAVQKCLEEANETIARLKRETEQD
jgi:primosomal protein N''